uniref:Delta-like protein n=1 Tax=Hymenolepis diminuta TaxID=6216 RepID=A0A0R3SIN0_HYMDI
LYFELHYENKHGVVSDGKNCDSFVFNRLCDIFFEICITDEDNIKYVKLFFKSCALRGLCNLFFDKTSPVRNTVAVEHYFKLPYFTNKFVCILFELYVKIRALDFDHLSSPDMLGEFHFAFRPYEVPSLPQTEEVAFSSSKAHPSTKMKLYVSRKCEPDHFGNRCELCRAETGHGYCDALGNLVCYPGRRCEEGYDPCEEHICWHSGTCVPTGEHLNFPKCVNCSGRWSGLHCDEELDACEYEASKLEHSPCMNGGHCVVNPVNENEFMCFCSPGWQGPNCEIPLSKSKGKEDACELEASRLGHPPCANGGHCVVDPSNETMFSCLCTPGWQGFRCDVSFSKASAVVTVVSIFILILIFCCIIGLACSIRIFALPKIRHVIKKQKAVELTQVNANELSETNNLYQLMQDQIPSPPPSYSASWTKEGGSTLVKPTPQPDDDIDEYEYEAMSDQVECNSAKAVLEISEGEDYEPINYRYQSIPKSEAVMSAANNEYDDNDDAIAETTLKRPLPSTPATD